MNSRVLPILSVAYLFAQGVFQNLFSSWFEQAGANSDLLRLVLTVLGIMALLFVMLNLLKKPERIEVQFQKARGVLPTESLSYKGLIAVVPPITPIATQRQPKLEALAADPRLLADKCPLEPIVMAVRRCGGLERLWLITTCTQETDETGNALRVDTVDEAGWLAAHLKTLFPTLDIRWNKPELTVHHDLNADILNRSYEIVQGIFEHHLDGLTPDQVVCEVTSGMKPLTIGMVLACLAPDRDILYHGFKDKSQRTNPAQFKFKTEKLGTN